MDLFVVNRFLGDDAATANQEGEEKNNLAKLMRKVEERRNQKLLKLAGSQQSTEASVSIKDGSGHNVPTAYAEEEGEKDSVEEALSEERLSKVSSKRKKSSVPTDAASSREQTEKDNGAKPLLNIEKWKKKRPESPKPSSAESSSDKKKSQGNAEKEMFVKQRNLRLLAMSGSVALPISETLEQSTQKNSTENDTNEEGKMERLISHHSETNNLEDGDVSKSSDIMVVDADTEKAKKLKSDKTPGEGFTILGDNTFGKKEHVRRVLPNWLANPSVISGKLQQLTTTVDDIPGINASLRKKLRENGITHFFPIQSLVIPWMLSEMGKPRQFWPQDICVSAPTGSGKTLSYVIPVIEALRSRVVPHIRALVVLPVQDLAAQVAKVFKTYCEGTDLKVVLITRKTDFAAEQREMIYTNCVTGPQSIADIIITTTGRIVDHIRLTPGFSLQHLRFLVIDEADRIMEDIKHDWIVNVYNHINSFSKLKGQRFLTVSALQSEPPPPQKLLFSATLSEDPEQLHAFNLFQPKMFTAVIASEGAEAGDREEKFMVPAELTEKICIVSLKDKPLVLYHLIVVEKCKRILCIADSQVQAHSLALLLTHLGKGEIRVAETSAALNRDAREKIVAQFADGQIDILISTDNLSRGIDIPTVDYVVNYNVPKYLRNYVHRVGRTARAGRLGVAITFAQSHQEKWFRSMVEGMGTLVPLDIDEAVISSYADSLADAVERMNKDLEKEKQAAVMERDAKKRGWRGTQHKDKVQKRKIAKTSDSDNEEEIETES